MSATSATEQKQHYKEPETPKLTFFTTTKTIQIAIYFFSSLLIGTAIVIGKLLPAVPLILFAVGIVILAKQLNDYEDPAKLAQYKKEADQLDFKGISKKFNFNNAIKYKLLPMSDLKEKFNNELNASYFEKIAQRYNLDELIKLGIASPSLMRKIEELEAKLLKARLNFLYDGIKLPFKATYQKAKQNYLTTCEALQTTFQQFLKEMEI